MQTPPPALRDDLQVLQMVAKTGLR
ncbi:protein of unknown function [Nitrospira defluvii]|uniref:Uncharacterized protein n=1 Tax=Nitrospira defluvii TaxID=330214 RepID=D8P8V1_9BACT|nr:protein of unknown function [Nitrospira defluvii]